MKYVVLLVCLLTAGCATGSESQHLQPSAEVVKPQVDKSEAKRQQIRINLESDLIIAFWAHLGDQRRKLQREMSESNDPDTKAVYLQFIQILEEEQNKAFQTIFDQ